MVPRVIKTEADYSEALSRVGELMGAIRDTPEGNELELLSTLIEAYEQRTCPMDRPDPVEVIKFRMEQLGKKPKDLVPLIGSKSKVSEVLSGKRKLSLKMIRNLRQLGIPADSLLQEPEVQLPQVLTEWDRYPVVEMAKRGWFESFRGAAADAREYAEELMTELFSCAGKCIEQPILARRHARLGSEVDSYGLLAWQARVMSLAKEVSVGKYIPGGVDKPFMTGLVNLSYLNDGPRLAQEYLGNKGIVLVALQHLPRTHLDGAAMIRDDGRPVIALTLRHDRLDHFWFTLCHELAHVALHLSEEQAAFVDDLEADGDKLEDEADQLAAETLIPKDAWEEFKCRGDYSAPNVKSFAQNLRADPAIVMGRIHHETCDFRINRQLLGLRRVRLHYPHYERGDAWR
jgi:HTH-type transcriptional regulator/antitoxin HigA